MGGYSRPGTGGMSHGIPGRPIAKSDRTIFVEQFLQLPFQVSFEVCRTVHANTLNMNKAVKMSKTMLVFSAFEDVSGLELHNNAQHSSFSVRDDHKGNKVAGQRRVRVVER